MDDLISRQQAIETFKDCAVNGVGIDGIVDALEQLPPIQPVNCSEFPNNSDTISRQAAIDAIDECYCGGEDSCGEPWIYKENAVEAINMIEPLPPAEPQIIRCKDCKHFIREDREEYTPYGFYNTYFDAFCDKHWDNEQGEYINVKLDDFCSFAEKREVTT